MNLVCRNLCTLSATLVLVLSCFTTQGCRSPVGGSAGNSGCQGGSCGVPVSSHSETDQTPAELFAEMNFEEIAAEQTRDANRAEIVARIPRGPDSLFAGMR